jgi:hypothetical protein
MKNKGMLWMVAALAVVFLAGGVSGVFVGRLVIPARHDAPRHGRPFPSLEMLAHDLSLSADQQARISEIFRQSEARFRDLRVEVHAHLGQLRDQLRSEIENVLTPDQGRKFEALIQEYVAQRQKEMDARRKDTQENSRKGN